MKKLILLILLLISINANSSHLLSADLGYIAINDTTYIINLKIYTDCSPNLIDTNSIGISILDHQTDTFYKAAQVLKFISVKDVSYTCDSILNRCNGGSLVGVQEYLFSDTFFIKRGKWRIIFFDGGRYFFNNLQYQSTSNTPYYTEAYLNNEQQSNSTSIPILMPIIYTCIGDDRIYSYSAIDNDSLVFVHTYTRKFTYDTILFKTPYTITYPFDSEFYIKDQTKKNINFQVNLIGSSIITFRVEEYREGKLIGYVVRDIAMISYPCDIPPKLELRNNKFTICDGKILDIKIVSKSNIDSIEIFNIDFTKIETIGDTLILSIVNLKKDQIFFISLRRDQCPFTYNNLYYFEIEIDTTCIINSIEIIEDNPIISVETDMFNTLGQIVDHNYKGIIIIRKTIKRVGSVEVEISKIIK